jgi:hypothetical protein
MKLFSLALSLCIATVLVGCGGSKTPRITSETSSTSSSSMSSLTHSSVVSSESSSSEVIASSVSSAASVSNSSLGHESSSSSLGHESSSSSLGHESSSSSLGHESSSSSLSSESSSSQSSALSRTIQAQSYWPRNSGLPIPAAVTKSAQEISYAVYQINADGIIQQVEIIDGLPTEDHDGCDPVSWQFTTLVDDSLLSVVGGVIAPEAGTYLAVGDNLFTANNVLFGPIIGNSVYIGPETTLLLQYFLADRSVLELAEIANGAMADAFEQFKTPYFKKLGYVYLQSNTLPNYLNELRETIEATKDARLMLQPQQQLPAAFSADPIDWTGMAMIQNAQHTSGVHLFTPQQNGDIALEFYDLNTAGHQPHNDTYGLKHTGDGVWDSFRYTYHIDRVDIASNTLHLTYSPENQHELKLGERYDVSGFNIFKAMQGLPFTTIYDNTYIDLTATFTQGAEIIWGDLHEITDSYRLSFLRESQSGCQSGVVLAPGETNCERARTLTYSDQDGAFKPGFAKTLNGVLWAQADLATDGSTLIALSHYYNAPDEQDVWLQLINNADRTVHFYKPDASKPLGLTLIASSTWSKGSVPGYTGAPADILEITMPNKGNFDYIHFGDYNRFFAVDEGYVLSGTVGTPESPRQVAIINDIAIADILRVKDAYNLQGDYFFNGNPLRITRYSFTETRSANNPSGCTQAVVQGNFSHRAHYSPQGEALYSGQVSIISNQVTEGSCAGIEWGDTFEARISADGETITIITGGKTYVGSRALT